MKRLRAANIFAGKSGVYYAPENDNLWVIEEAEPYQTFNFKTKTHMIYPRYIVETEKIRKELLAINASKHFTWIGEL